MKTLKTILFSAALTVGAFTTTFFTSCDPDACKDVICANDGTCTDGTCACTAGFEGTLCETQTRAKFIKTWSASDLQSGSSTPFLYSCIISAGTGSSNLDVIIDNSFSDDYFVNNINANVSGNTINIPFQKPDGAADSFAVAGSGTITAGKINWNYTLTKTTTSAALNYSGVWQ